MEPWPFPKARPISCNDSPAFQRRHMSVLCSAESLSRLPCAINTTFRKMIHMVLHRPVETARLFGFTFPDSRFYVHLNWSTSVNRSRLRSTERWLEAFLP